MSPAAQPIPLLFAQLIPLLFVQPEYALSTVYVGRQQLTVVRLQDSTPIPEAWDSVAEQNNP